MSELSESGKTGPRRTRKIPKRITESYLKNVALWYLERYASSAANLRNVLMRRVRESAAYHDTDPADGAAMVEELIRRYAEAGILNDRLFAETRARSLAARGSSEKMIRRKLMEKGVPPGDIDGALETVREEGGSELDAACRYARRRRIGPFRSAEKRAETRDRDLAALARQGFSFDIAATVVDAESPGVLDAELNFADRY
ncbi:RecX family transcriptional regulator [Nisaea acidiphila]|uniref:Regulatory protein RecX n=1 Tax=Nisaea acidiphila TaxID=1862145 RepID=A0A9J7AVW8_9PROT|nr:RecX family transcriptional regulator [Nisaea acidiphila]UUX51931.1 RecX family transcriptional regulator [Nisaea acidiphila]